MVAWPVTKAGGLLSKVAVKVSDALLGLPAVSLSTLEGMEIDTLPSAAGTIVKSKIWLLAP